MEEFLYDYLQYHITNVSVSYLNNIVKLSQNLEKILDRRYERLLKKISQIENMGNYEIQKI